MQTVNLRHQTIFNLFTKIADMGFCLYGMVLIIYITKIYLIYYGSSYRMLAIRTYLQIDPLIHRTSRLTCVCGYFFEIFRECIIIFVSQ